MKRHSILVVCVAVAHLGIGVAYGDEGSSDARGATRATAADTKVAIADAEERIKVALQQYHDAATEEDAARLRSHLAAGVQDEFDIRQAVQLKNVREQIRHLQAIEQRIQGRHARRDEIVESRVNQLLTRGQNGRGDDGAPRASQSIVEVVSVKNTHSVRGGHEIPELKLRSLAVKENGAVRAIAVDDLPPAALNGEPSATHTRAADDVRKPNVSVAENDRFQLNIALIKDKSDALSAYRSIREAGLFIESPKEHTALLKALRQNKSAEVVYCPPVVTAFGTEISAESNFFRVVVKPRYVDETKMSIVLDFDSVALLGHKSDATVLAQFGTSTIFRLDDDIYLSVHPEPISDN